MSLSVDHTSRLLILAAWWPSIFRPGRNSGLPSISAIYKDGTKTFRRARAPKPDFSWRQARYAAGFEMLPKRSTAERTFGWLQRCRRLAKELGCYARTHAAFIILAMIRIM